MSGAAVIMHWNRPPTKRPDPWTKCWARRHLGGRSPAFSISAKMTNIRSLGERPILINLFSSTDNECFVTLLKIGRGFVEIHMEAILSREAIAQI